MSQFEVSNIVIEGIAAAVPKNAVRNYDEKFIQTTGVESRRIAPDNLCTSDFCYESANQLLNDLQIDRKDISVLVFVSQTPDYYLPSSSSILQNRLGLSQSCVAIDISLGCSGFVYGLSVISSLMKTTEAKFGLLLVGDTISKIVDQNDSSTNNLFGDAGSATFLRNEHNIETTFSFDLGSDGSGADVIIQPNSGYRKSNDSNFLKMNGMDVFGFGISKVPQLVKNIIKQNNLNADLLDQSYFHQANLFMNFKIAKKIGLKDSNVLYSIKDFGNTSSASIPLTMLVNNQDTTNKNLLLCGFGVGLSWGALIIKNCNKIYFSKLIEL